MSRGFKIVEYSDGVSGFWFSEPGQVFDIDNPAQPRFERLRAAGYDALLPNVAIVVTESNNQYGLTNGVLLNQRQGLAQEIPQDSDEIVIGQPWQISRGRHQHTTRVKHVIVDALKRGYEPDIRSNEPSPFKNVARQAIKWWQTQGYEKGGL